jgi:hypothetical protein
MIPAVFTAAEPKRSNKPAPPPAIVKLGWLAGHWRMEQGGRVIDAQWMAPAAGVMLGMSRTITKGRVLEHEFMQIREGPGGMLFYVSQPAGQPDTTYQQTAQTETDVSFENLLHDFPQRISFTRQPDGAWVAAVEGRNPDGTTRRVEYGLARVQP